MLAKPELAEKFLAHPKWIRLGIAIYGGLDSSIGERITEAKDKIDQIRYEETIAQSTQSKETIEHLAKERSEWEAILKN